MEEYHTWNGCFLAWSAFFSMEAHWHAALALGVEGMATFVFMWCQSAPLDSFITGKRKTCARGWAKPWLQLWILRDIWNMARFKVNASVVERLIVCVLQLIYYLIFWDILNVQIAVKHGHESKHLAWIEHQAITWHHRRSVKKLSCVLK